MSNKRYIHVHISTRETVDSYTDAAVHVEQTVAEEDAAMPSGKAQGLLKVAESLRNAPAGVHECETAAMAKDFHSSK